MKNNKRITIYIPSIGDVLFENSFKAKHIIISIKLPNKIRVAVPQNISFNEAKTFTNSNKNWIQKKLLQIAFTINNKIQLKPIDINIARIPLEKRIKFLSTKYGFSYKKLFIKNQKTRWGSCSQKNNINLNARLMHLPQELIDYVIIHELVHTKIKNHSITFWSKLDELVGNAKYYKTKLNNYIIIT